MLYLLSIYIGWGHQEFKSKTEFTQSHILKQATLPIVQSPHIGCHNNTHVICAGSGFDLKAPVACPGDSGGPLVCQRDDGRWQLEGVSSFVYTYCKYFSAFVPVNEYVDWIKKTIS